MTIIEPIPYSAAKYWQERQNQNHDGILGVQYRCSRFLPENSVVGLY